MKNLNRCPKCQRYYLSELYCTQCIVNSNLSEWKEKTVKRVMPLPTIKPNPPLHLQYQSNSMWHYQDND